MRTLQSGHGRFAAGALVGALTAALFIEGLASELPTRDPPAAGADPTVPEPIPPGQRTSTTQPVSTTTPTSSTTTSTTTPTRSTTTTTTTTKSVTTTPTTTRPPDPPPTTTVPTTTSTRCTFIICP